MSDAVVQTPTPAPQPVPPAQPSENMTAYLAQWDAKRERMQSSWRRAAIWLVALLALGLGATIAIGELQPLFQLGLKFISDLVQKKNLPMWIPLFVSLFVPAFILLQIIQAVPAVLVWWERKVAAHMQGRLGP